MSPSSELLHSRQQVTAALGDNTVVLFTVPTGRSLRILSLIGFNITTVVIMRLQVTTPLGVAYYIQSLHQAALAEAVEFDALPFLLPAAWVLSLTFLGCAAADALQAEMLYEVLRA